MPEVKTIIDLYSYSSGPDVPKYLVAFSARTSQDKGMRPFQKSRESTPRADNRIVGCSWSLTSCLLAWRADQSDWYSSLSRHDAPQIPAMRHIISCPNKPASVPRHPSDVAVRGCVLLIGSTTSLLCFVQRCIECSTFRTSSPCLFLAFCTSAGSILRRYAPHEDKSFTGNWKLKCCAI